MPLNPSEGADHVTIVKAQGVSNRHHAYAVV
jgi:hypothetical protein